MKKDKKSKVEVDPKTNNVIINEDADGFYFAGKECTEDQFYGLCTVAILKEHREDVLNGSQKLAENGWISKKIETEDNSYHQLEPIGNPAFASMIPAVAFGFDKGYTSIMSAPGFFANTMNHGPVYAVPNGDETMVVAPVNTPCILGGVTHPTGVYTPINGGSDSIRAGIEMLEAFEKLTLEQEKNIAEGNDTAICNCPTCATEELTGIRWSDED